MNKTMAYNEEEIKTFKDIIINALSEGSSLKSILDSNKDLPNRTTVYTWLNNKHENYDDLFFNNYAHAREESADLDAEKIQELAEKTLKGDYDPASARVALDAYKWSAGKKKPKKYGDRLELDVNETKMTPEERNKEIEKLKALLNEPN